MRDVWCAWRCVPGFGEIRGKGAKAKSEKDKGKRKNYKTIDKRKKEKAVLRMGSGD
jgi:hypothetical protein